MITLAIVLVALGVPLVLACGYLLLLTLASARLPAPAPTDPSLRFDLIVPAHDEEAGIADTVRNLLEIDWPRTLFRVVVVADNCTDATALRALAAGATVLERTDNERRGKGYALELAFAESARAGSADAVVVIDADTLVSGNLLAAFAARLRDGARAAQADYAVRNPGASWRTQLMAIALGMFHVVRSRGRERLGLSCGLRGNGMCFSVSLLREVPHDAYSLVEDVEYGLRLGALGHRVHYAGDAHVYGEMVTKEAAARSQRRRWEEGRKALARRAPALLAVALREGDCLRLDLALDLLVPPLSTLVLLSMLGAALSLGLRLLGAPAFPLWPYCACLVMLFFYGIRGWSVSGTGLRGLVALLLAPLFVLWKIVLRLGGRDKQRHWVRTAREGKST